MNLFTHKGFKPWQLNLMVALWLATVGNAALWKTVVALPELGNAKGYGFMLALAVIVAAVLTMMTALFSWPWVQRCVLTALLIVAATCTYFMWTYGVVIDRGMIVNALQTDSKETLEILSVRLLGFLGVLAGIPVWAVWRVKVVYSPFLRQTRHNLLLALLALLIAVLAVVLSFQTLSSTMRNHTQIRHLITPLNALWGAGSVVFNPVTARQTQVLTIGEDAAISTTAGAAERPPLLLLVVGETARSDHFSLNGYSRPTNPQLSKEPLLSFTNAWSCGTNTAVSVPCMFSHLGKTDYEASDVRYESLLDVAQKAGLAVVWIDNQAGCKGVCDRVPNASTTALTHPEHCANGECRDSIMLTVVDAEIAKLPAAARAKGVLVVMHQMGSHGPAYYKRSNPEHKVFQPECTHNALNTCDTAQVVNAYDNTIVATDDFLARTITWLKNKVTTHRAAMMYVSDHGESLGEGNIFLHGLPYRFAPDAQKHIPWLVWLGAGTERTCPAQHEASKISHDFYFHTVLGMLNVVTALYQPELDLLKPCKASFRSNSAQ